ncbi:MAG: DsbA family protein, partial [Nocardiopsaceae bacterium]|nr:DsbA family protein [Nocardiopsaceae bacterium]
MPKASTPRFYFSLRSPYSWLAYADLHRRYPDLAGRLEWRPFWEPDARSERMLAEAGGRFVYTPMSKEKHLYILQDIRRLAAERGLRVGWPVDVDPCWEVPHLAYFAALEHGQGHEFIRLVCDLRWRDGRDICQPDTMAEAADRLGLDPGELAGA